MIKTIENNIEKSNDFVKILKGSGLAIIITLIFLLFYSILLTYTSLSESTISTVIIIITAISILIGSQLSLSHIRKNGLVNGGMVGLIYIFILYFISSIITGNFNFNLQSIIMIIVSIISRNIRGNYWSE